MRGRYHFIIAGLLCVSALCVAAAAEPLRTGQRWPARVPQAKNPEHPTLRPQLIVEPDDGIEPVLSLIKHASSSVDVVMYDMEDDQVEHALAAAAARGARVRVILDNGYYGINEKATNDDASDYLAAHGVEVHKAPSYFTLTHQKTLVIDHAQALIMTFNFVPKYYASARDFAVVDTDPTDVSAIEDVFEDDWHGVKDRSSEFSSQLVWSPGSKATFLAFIQSATKALDVYNEEMADADITHALAHAAQRGVRVRIVMTYATRWRNALEQLVFAGVQVYTYAARGSLFIHAKVIIVDGHIAFVGSQNFSYGSMETNRELGIFVTDRAVIAQLENIFQNDESNAREMMPAAMQ